MWQTYSKILLILIWGCLTLARPGPTQAQDRIAFDVKINLSEKVDLAPVEVGTTICLTQSDWANVRETGEEYSLWLKEYERIKEGKDTRAKLTVELRTPALLRSGRLIATRQFMTAFRTRADGMNLPDTLRWNQEDLNAMRKAITDELSESAAKIRREALSVGTAVCTAAQSMVEEAR